MFNSGLVLSEIDGTEFLYEDNKDGKEIPKVFSYMKNLPDVLDQGSDPICVPCSISSYLEYKLSITSRAIKSSHFALFDIFNSRTTSGEGMTCKEAFKHILREGAKYKNGIIKISKYFMITNIFMLRHAIYCNGPCILVLPVYDSNEEKFWKETAPFQGYHAVSVVGYDQDGFIIRNSWGKKYGYEGYSYISNEDIQRAKEIWTLI